MAINLYGASVFGQAYKAAEIRGMNNAPGGDGGVDTDVQFNLGAPGASSMRDRKHGICCGIAVAWIVGVCHKREDAINTTHFKDYFDNVLRFQGAYVKDFKGNAGAMDDLQGIHPLGLKKAASGSTTDDALAGLFPSSGAWAAYLSLYHHAVGIGCSSSRYLIMEPNAGLFKYKSKSAFITDVKQLCQVRRAKKNGAADFGYSIFRKA